MLAIFISGRKCIAYKLRMKILPLKILIFKHQTLEIVGLAGQSLLPASMGWGGERERKEKFSVLNYLSTTP
jgi:hypothetical protein